MSRYGPWRQNEGDKRGGQEHERNRHVPESHEGENRDRGTGGDGKLGEVLAEEGLQLLDAVDHREHHAACPLLGEPGGAEVRDLVEEQHAQLALHRRRDVVSDVGAALVEERAGQHGEGGGREPGQGCRRAVPVENGGQGDAEEGEARDAGTEGQQAQEGAQSHAAAEAGRQAPEAEIEIHGRLCWLCGPLILCSAGAARQTRIFHLLFSWIEQR